MLSVVIGEKCGYVRGSLAATNDTVIINLDCNQLTPSSHYVPLQLRDNATHVAVQLVHCHTVPVGLFINVTDNLTSLTVASEDAVHLLEGTFEGLGHLIELRLLGFAKLKNMSRSVLEPLRNIHTLILDGFGSTYIKLPYLGSVIRKLSGTPIRRLVLNKIKDDSHVKLVMQVDNFRISNASLKELIITDVPFNFEGSIRLAFPELTCFCAGRRIDEQTPETYPTVFDLIFLSEHLKELVLYRPYTKLDQNTSPVPMTRFLNALLNSKNLSPDLLHYIFTRTASEYCALGFIFKIGDNLSKVKINDILLRTQPEKPICIQDDNNLRYLDFTGSNIPGSIPVLTGLKKLKYFSLENTNMRTLPNTLIQYYPALEVLKLSKIDLGNFIKNIDEDFFGSCPTLADIYLDNCNITNIPTTIFSRSINLQHLDMSNNYLRTFDFDLQNCTRLNILNFSRNNIESISRNGTVLLTQLVLRKPKRNNLVLDLTDNRLHCLCNSTHFIKWLQRSPTDIYIKFPGFDSYACLYPNGSIVRVSEVIVSELEQQCSVLQTLVNGSDCPCDEETRRRVEHVWMSLDGFFCRNDVGDLVTMKSQPLPSCFIFNPYLQAPFIAPVVIGGILGITALITVGLLIYYRKSERVRNLREFLQRNPVQVLREVLRYVHVHNHAEEHALFEYDMIIFVQDDDRSSIHRHFIQALHKKKRFITGDDFRPGELIVDAMAESARVCQWIVAVLTSNFLSDPVCVDFISRVQFDRPHSLIPIVWEQPLAITKVSIRELLRTGEPLYWPGDLAAPEDERNFWVSLLERTIPIR